MESGHLEIIFDRLGHFGRYQIFIYFTCAFQNISCGIHYLASVFMTVLPKHTCRPPGKVRQVLFQNTSIWRLEDVWTLFTSQEEYHVVVLQEDGEVWELKSCHRYRWENVSLLNDDYNGIKSSFPCLDGYIYDNSKWYSTVVTQWDLVCNREWFARLIQPTFMFGVLLGALIFGYLSDRVGRRMVLLSTSMGMYVFGIAAAFMLDYYSFMLARFLLAIVSSGYLVVVFVYVTEFVGRKIRTWASVQVHSFFALGTMVVAVTGYFVRTWWSYQLILSSVTIPFIFCFWALPETPFWLLSEGRHEEAQAVVDTMAKWNRASTCAVEIPAYIFVCLGMDTLGRRAILTFSLLSCAVSCGLIMLIPRIFYHWVMLTSMVGKFAIGSVFGLIYLYTAELYPTMIRTQAIGSGSMVSRAGSIIAPFSLYLSGIWTFMPQLLVGILALVSGILTLKLPETLGQPLATTWEEAMKLDAEKKQQSR
ncbi:solute carrier family 22 member 16 [Phyllostomus discolor]|uniref:Solute carrier family 22 member 16 n=1 Tax=Phyllostomus discolor TaxID=89673 RepID=A0A834APF9_9CHIR|nr:solute carrier family 22 member 16 [Phyllostomus discolor]